MTKEISIRLRCINIVYAARSVGKYKYSVVKSILLPTTRGYRKLDSQSRFEVPAYVGT